MAGLTPKQIRFCEQYLVDLNATQAALRAGYSPRTAQVQSTGLLSKPIIQEYIHELKANRSVRTEIKADRVLEEIAVNALSDIASYVTIGEDGALKVKTFDEMLPNASRAIQSIKEKKRILSTGEGDEVTLESTLEIKLWDKNKALDMLNRHLNLYNDKDAGKDAPSGEERSAADTLIEDAEHRLKVINGVH